MENWLSISLEKQKLYFIVINYVLCKVICKFVKNEDKVLFENVLKIYEIEKKKQCFIFEFVGLLHLNNICISISPYIFAISGKKS